MPRKDSITAPATAQAQQDAVTDGIDKYELPKSLVTRIAKSAIPEQSKLQKDTVTALVRGSTVFINYLAATAHDVATSRQHKSVSAADVLKALENIQFGDMVLPLQHELQIYRELVKSSKKGGRFGGGTGESASGRSKGVGKGKGKGRAVPAASASIPELASRTADGDTEMADADEDEDVEDEDEDEQDELADDVDEEELEPELEEAEDGGEEEDIVDPMAIEEDELEKDQRRADLDVAANHDVDVGDVR